MSKYHKAILWRDQNGIKRLVATISMAYYPSSYDALEVAKKTFEREKKIKEGDTIEILLVLERTLLLNQGKITRMVR